jgi:signal transduction histidine kinase
MLSHDRRNPLAPIEAAIEVIRRSVPEEAPVFKASKIVARQVRNLSVMLNDLLGADRTVRGMFTIDPHGLSWLRSLTVGQYGCWLHMDTLLSDLVAPFALRFVECIVGRFKQSRGVLGTLRFTRRYP